MTYLFGADPELCIYNTRTKKFVSGHDIIPGTKENPHKVDCGAVQLDGVMAEFNIDPADNFEDFKGNILTVKKQLLKMVKEYSKDLTLVASPTAIFDQEYFDKVIPETSKELGCQPDYCAGTGLANPRPDPGNRPFRTGGGHVHIGWTKDMKLDDPAHFMDCRLLTKSLYGSGLNRDSLWDKDNERRTLYGSKYSFRPKSFGMEYRYLSNAWVDNLKAMKFVFDVAQKVVSSMDSAHLKDYSVRREIKPKYYYGINIPKKLRDENNLGYTKSHTLLYTA